jgi:FAD/FMN-containing dehydrogenase/SAM-dependent methyltransferase
MALKKKLRFKAICIGIIGYLLISFFLIGKDVYHAVRIQPSRVKHEPAFAKYVRFDKEKRCVPRESSLTAGLAIFNDEFLKNGAKYWTRVPASVVGSRLIAITLFPITLASDFVYATGMGLYCKMTGKCENAVWYRMRVVKNLLGLLFTPASLIGADLVTNHFIPLEKEKRAISPYGKLYSAHALELYPKSIEEVQEIIRKAKKLNKKVTIAGKLFSQGKQALPINYKDILLYTDLLNEVVIDAEKKVAICAAGATWEKVQAAANEKALAVKVMQASNIFSVGGSLSINCHGWDHKAGSLDQTTLAIHLVNAEGELLRLTPEDELFRLAIGGLGGFGVIVKAEISLIDNELLHCQGEVVAPSSYLDYFRKKVIADPSIALHYYRLSLEPGNLFREGIAVNYMSVGTPDVALLEAEPDKGNRLDRIELQTLRRVKALRKWAWNEEKLNALQPIRGTRNQMMQPPIRAILSGSNLDGEWLQEYFVKAESLEPFLAQLASILNKHKVAVFNASVRYVAKNDSQSFNYAPDGERFAVVLFFNQSLKPQDIAITKEWMEEVLHILDKFGGSYYLPYQAIPTIEQFRKSYPNWKEIDKLKRKWDPSGRFDNGFFSSYLSAQEDYLSPSSPYRLLLAKEGGMREETTAFLDNIFMQIDSSKLLCLMDEILEEKISDEEIYSRLLLRIAETKNGFYKNLLDSLRSLRSLQNELADQAKSLLGDEPLKGYIEIGYPGRMIRPLKKRLNLTGKMIVVNTEQHLADYLETGIPSPIDLFIPLHDYEPLNAEGIPSESVDLVSLFIGLHHIPKEKIAPFICSIERVLRPGGKLILMDHDAYSEKMVSFLSMVHSLFNAGTKVSANEENREYRNFKPLSYWINLASENGLIWDGQKPLVRQGDPTLNSVLILKKPETESFCFSDNMKKTRPGIQTYLTGPEWQNVRSAQSYAAFIEHTPFYQFPYFREIGNFWHVYKQSWKAARHHYSFFETLKAEYTFMNTFIGVMMTLEYGAKGLISLPLSWFYTQEENKEPLTTSILIQEAQAETPTYRDIPRYRKATPILIELALKGTEFLSICGQQRIQIDLILTENASIPSSIAGARFLYQVPLMQTPTAKLVAYEIPVSLLAEALRQLTQAGVAVDYIHDF